MPPGIMRAYLTMLPRLQAEESLRRALEHRAAIGGAEGQRIVRHWQRQVRSGEPRPDLDEAQVATRLAAMGIAYRRGRLTP